MAGENGNDRQRLTKQVTWELNHIAIRDAYLQFWQEHKSFPTQLQVSEICKLSRQSVNNHLRELKLDDITPGHKVEAEEILRGIAASAKKGDSSSAKLWFQLVFGWREKIEHEGSLTLNVDKIDFSRLNVDQLIRLKSGEAPDLILSELSRN